VKPQLGGWQATDLQQRPLPGHQPAQAVSSIRFLGFLTQPGAVRGGVTNPSGERAGGDVAAGTDGLHGIAGQQGQFVHGQVVQGKAVETSRGPYRRHCHRRGGAQAELASAVVAQLAGDLQVEKLHRAARLAHHLLYNADG
jgi:hypothetical protein